MRTRLAPRLAMKAKTFWHCGCLRTSTSQFWGSGSKTWKKVTNGQATNMTGYFLPKCIISHLIMQPWFRKIHTMTSGSFGFALLATFIKFRIPESTSQINNFGFELTQEKGFKKKRHNNSLSSVSIHVRSCDCTVWSTDSSKQSSCGALSSWPFLRVHLPWAMLHQFFPCNRSC